jgi:hypothetical protein
VVQCGVVQCGVVWYGLVSCIVSCGKMSNTTSHSAVQCCALLCSVFYVTVMHCIVLQQCRAVRPSLSCIPYVNSFPLNIPLNIPIPIPISQVHSSRVCE